MHGRKRQPMDDVGIKKLLTSTVFEDKVRGLEELDFAYRKQLFGLVKLGFDRYGFGLQPADLPDIWNDTLVAVWESVLEGKFKEKGSLKSYLGTIVVRKAINLLRKLRRGPDDRRFADDEEVEEPTEPEFPRETFLEALQSCIAALSPRDRELIELELELFLCKDCKFVSQDYFAQEYNARRKRRGKSVLPERTVNSRRQRARQRLRKLLKEKGLQ